MLKGLLNSNSIIRPQKFSFYYGYIIAFIGTIGILMSLPGQSIGVSTFTDPVKDALGLSRLQFSIAYLTGTFFSSLFLRKAGRWYDKYGARIVAFGAATGLSATLFLCSNADTMNNFIKRILKTEHYLVPLSMLTILFFMLRFSGQGVLTLVSRNMVMKWFDNFRGRINAASSIIVTLFFSAAPIWTYKLINSYGWQKSWLILAVVIAIFLLLIVLLYFDNPEQFGLIPDGKALHKSNDKKSDTKRKQFTLKEAKKTRAFWMYSLSLSFYSFFVTGLTIHVISIFKSAGYTENETVSVFVPISLIAVLVSLVANLISDWIKLKILLYLNIIGGFLASVGLLLLSGNAGIYLLSVGAGIMGGLFTVLTAVVWPRFYGRKYLGETTGKTMSMIVFATSLGPLIFSISYKYLETYSMVGIAGILFLSIISLMSLKANNPQ